MRRICCETLKSMNHQIIAVVVTYEPDPDVLKALLRAVAPQVGAVVIVDNGSKIDFSSLGYERPPGRTVTLIRLAENKGIAAAQNVGIAEAMRRNAEYVLLLDHDSVPAPDMVEKLRLACRELTLAGKKIAAAGPSYRIPNTNCSSYFVRFGMLRFKKIYSRDCAAGQYIPADFLISSGCLIPLSALKDIGLMDETLFIDHVDTDWFLRAKAKKYLFVGVTDASMNHCLGDSLFTFGFRKQRALPVHHPLRFYYIYRNSLLLYARPYASKKWIINDLVRLGLMFIFFTTITPPRLQYLKMIGKGIFDGLRGVCGRYPA